MPDVIIPGPAGRLEGKYSPSKTAGAPVALILHAHPRGGGHMETPVSAMLYDQFKSRGFSTVRFNFRGVGRSQGSYDQGLGELSDAATVLDWAQALNPNAPYCWVAGHSFGAWIAMQLLMRRPEIAGFISVSPPTNMYDFTFLAPCPASGLIAHGGGDVIVPFDEMERAMSKVRSQKGITITTQLIEGASHLFTHHLEPLESSVGTYLDKRLPEVEIEKAQATTITGRR
jgi:alpha/beta superfamily hydrolase